MEAGLPERQTEPAHGDTLSQTSGELSSYAVKLALAKEDLEKANNPISRMFRQRKVNGLEEMVSELTDEIDIGMSHTAPKNNIDN